MFLNMISNLGGVFVIIATIISTIYVITIVFTVILIVFENRDPVKTISWLLVIILIPIVGILLYMYFGQTFRKQKIFSKKEFADFERIINLSKTQIINLHQIKFLKNEKIKRKINIIKLLLNNSKALLTENNKVDVLNNGKETFNSIIYELENAKDHIHVEFYRINDDKIGNKIRKILIQKANEGLTVRLIFDDVGSWRLSKKYINSLKNAGVEVNVFMPVNFPFLTSKVNFRNHRKIVVIDGKIGFVGGLNIADKYIDGHKKLGFWRDTHLRLEGEAVSSLQVIFIIDWHFVSKEIISDQARYFPDYIINDRCPVQITTSGPDSDWASIMQAFFAAISTAEKKIFISTPYFLPNESILTALKTAALSGVDVRMILPHKPDSAVAHWSGMSYLSELLNAGIKVFLYKKGFAHAKLLMVDGIFSSVGTANMDNRSFDQNFEVNALIYDEKITEFLEKTFLEDIDNSEQIFADEWATRSRINKVKESLARILSPLY